MEEETFRAWRERRRAGDETATVINLYEMVARRGGLAAHELPIEERTRLSHCALHEIDPSFELTPNSNREPELIELVPYDPEWPARFEKWRRTLREVLPLARRIDHIGSTSVPGLPAKASIDVQVSVDDINAEASYVPPIEALGVQLRNRDAEHRYFRPFAGRPREMHVHVCNSGSRWERRHLLFVAFLRNDEAARKEYLQAKQLAVARWADDRVAYTEAKDEVIARISAGAEEWARATGWEP